MLKSDYKPRPNVYVRAHNALGELQKEIGGPISKAQAERKLKVTPGIMFGSEVSTYDDVFKILESWRLIAMTPNFIEVLEWNDNS
jgi:flagellar basal body rod protein FlgF